MSYVKSYKNKVFKRKYNTYHRRVKDYNDRFSPTPLIEDPALDDVERMDVSDLFWSGGSTLSHPGEPWASDLPTREGIQFFLSLRSSKEELCRIAREARQLAQWAIDYQARIDSVNRKSVDGIGDSSSSLDHSSLDVVLMFIIHNAWHR